MLICIATVKPHCIASKSSYTFLKGWPNLTGVLPEEADKVNILQIHWKCIFAMHVAYENIQYPSYDRWPFPPENIPWEVWTVRVEVRKCISWDFWPTCEGVTICWRDFPYICYNFPCICWDLLPTCEGGQPGQWARTSAVEGETGGGAQWEDSLCLGGDSYKYSPPSLFLQSGHTNACRWWTSMSLYQKCQTLLILRWSSTPASTTCSPIFSRSVKQREFFLDLTNLRDRCATALPTWAARGWASTWWGGFWGTPLPSKREGDGRSLKEE